MSMAISDKTLFIKASSKLNVACRPQFFASWYSKWKHKLVEKQLLKLFQRTLSKELETILSSYSYETSFKHPVIQCLLININSCHTILYHIIIQWIVKCKSCVLLNQLVPGGATQITGVCFLSPLLLSSCQPSLCWFCLCNCLYLQFAIADLLQAKNSI